VNIRIILIAIVVLIITPVVFYFVSNMNTEEAHAFRQMTITPVLENDGKVTVPTVSEDQLGALLHATFKPAFLEKTTGVKSPNPNGLDITVDSISSAIGACTPQGKIPPKAVFDIAVKCAETDFTTWKAEKKTALFLDPTEHLIVFGATDNNLARVYHNNMIASYTSPDMLQSDRKREACIVRAMLDHLVGIKPDPDASCAGAP
jgi:hypothetical protein